MRTMSLSLTTNLLLVLAGFALQGCRPKQTIIIQLVEPKPVATEEGVKLETRPGRTLAYIEVIESSPNVKSVTRLTENEDRNIVVGPPVLSPTEDTMVYWEMPIKITRDTQGSARLSRKSNIYKQAIGSLAKTRITYGNRTDLYPAFCPDGNDILFSSNRTGPNPTLWRISLAGGGGITKITNTLAEDYAPCISPDGTVVVYASNPPGAKEPQIWKVGYNGLLPTQLRVGRSPHVSPDGTKILLVRLDKDSGRKQLWSMSMGGSEETQLTSNTDFNVEDARWSPDGQKIIYASNEGVDSRKRHNFDIWMIDADGTSKTQLTTNGSHDDSPCWDRSGKFIYFRSNRGGAWNIWRFEPVDS
jgi:Tol biopolymer transport system component